jgi:hypothetical protein
MTDNGEQIKSLILMALSALAFSLMSLLVKLASIHHIPSFQTVFARSIIQLLIAIIYMSINKTNPITGDPISRDVIDPHPEIESLLPEAAVPQQDPESELDGASKQESNLYIAVYSPFLIYSISLFAGSPVRSD